MQNASATTLPHIPIADLFAEADVVALVEVTEGHLLGEGKDNCGAKYRATVTEGLKGVDSGSVLEFGQYIGYEIGNRYLLFLTKPGRSYEPKMSINGELESARQAAIRKCLPQWTFFRVMHSGNGALPVNWSTQFDYKDSVRIPLRYVGVPESVPQKPAMPSDNEEFSSVFWVRLDDLLTMLRSLKK